MRNSNGRLLFWSVLFSVVAVDFITKPILDFDRDLMSAVTRAIDANRSAIRTGSPLDAEWTKVFRDLDALSALYGD